MPVVAIVNAGTRLTDLGRTYSQQRRSLTYRKVRRAKESTAKLSELVLTQLGLHRTSPDFH